MPERIPILAWVGPPPEETTVDRYRELAGCGFTLNFSPQPNADAVTKALDAAQAAGVKQYISLPELQSDPEGTARRFRSHPALGGYHLVDEPGAGAFAGLAAWMKRIRTVDPDHPCYINLLPNYATPDQLGAPTYAEYVDRFLREVPTPFLSFDHYPITASGLRPNWYENLEICSRAARKAGIPLWPFLLAVAHNPYPIPEVSHLRLEAFSDLAYGAQCLQVFTYWTPQSTIWNFHQAPIDGGKRTVVYDRLRQVTTEVQGLARVFAGAQVLRVGHTGTLPQGTEAYGPESPVADLRTESNGAVVSLLGKGRQRYLVVVNRDYQTAMPLAVRLDGRRAVREERKDGTSPRVGREFARSVEPGDLVVLSWQGEGRGGSERRLEIGD